MFAFIFDLRFVFGAMVHTIPREDKPTGTRRSRGVAEGKG
jgi:hypothetical protein